MKTDQVSSDAILVDGLRYRYKGSMNNQPPRRNSSTGGVPQQQQGSGMTAANQMAWMQQQMNAINQQPQPQNYNQQMAAGLPNNNIPNIQNMTPLQQQHLRLLHMQRMQAAAQQQQQQQQRSMGNMNQQQQQLQHMQNNNSRPNSTAPSIINNNIDPIVAMNEQQNQINQQQQQMQIQNFQLQQRELYLY